MGRHYILCKCIAVFDSSECMLIFKGHNDWVCVLPNYRFTVYKLKFDL